MYQSKVTIKHKKTMFSYSLDLCFAKSMQMRQHSAIEKCLHCRTQNEILIYETILKILKWNKKHLLKRKMGSTYYLIVYLKKIAFHIHKRETPKQSSSSYIFHAVVPLVDPFRPHVPRSLFNDLPWSLLPVGQ